MTAIPIRKAVPRTARTQRGAVLYIALIMLILLALIGVIGAQVSSMQERMSANYRAANMAIQRAEDLARANETCIETKTNRTGSCTVAVDPYCDSPVDPDPASWARKLDLSKDGTVRVRSIGKCISGAEGLGMGKKPESEEANPIFQITAYATDRAEGEATSAAVVDTIFRP